MHASFLLTLHQSERRAHLDGSSQVMHNMPSSFLVFKAWMALLLVSAFLEIRFGHKYFARSSRAIQLEQQATASSIDERRDKEKIKQHKIFRGGYSSSSATSRQGKQEILQVLAVKRDDETRPIIARNTTNNLLFNASQPVSIAPFPNGGIFYFLHIPKVGGTSMRDHFAKSVDKLIVIRNKGQLLKHLPKIQHWTSHGTSGKIIAIETHTNDVPAWSAALHEHVQSWRNAANRHNVSFFAFTLVREPLSFATSAFNYYYLKSRVNKTSGEAYQLAQATSTELVDTLLHNPICSFLSRGGFYYAILDGGIRHEHNRKRLNDEQTRQHCDTAYQTLVDGMDWIGTTDKLYETVEIVDYLMSSSSSKADALKASIVATNATTSSTAAPVELTNQNVHKQVTLDQLDETQLDFVRKHTSYDDEWYNAIQGHYSFDELWKNRVRQTDAGAGAFNIIAVER
ncbi:hypothetical protein MPSEU_000971700 [Mayamaea pseudoterrestris]|nr:hypothetical protein MPSEU_000971700 [Mayamaea pseudoterrestris]